MSPALPQKTALSAAARELHFGSLVVDTHVDTTQRLIAGEFDMAKCHADGSVDIPRLREGGVGAVFFAVWIRGSVTGREAVDRAFAQIAAIRRCVGLHPADLALARTAEDVSNARSGGQIAVLMGVEGGHMLGGDLQVLREFSSLGVSYLTLTHNITTDWADSSTGEARHNGLSGFGKQVIEEMNRLGMIVDVSHVSDKAFNDVLAASDAPVLASHSSCRALCESPRNLPDEMIRSLAAKGGLIQINFHTGFLSREFREAEKSQPELAEQMEVEIADLCGENEACKLLESDRIIRGHVAKGKLPLVDWKIILEHIDHAVKIAGVDHVGLGSDFDGAIMPYGMEDATCLPRITEGLLQRGYPENDIRKILGGNALRLMQDVRVAARFNTR